MKKIFSVFAVICIALMFVGCGGMKTTETPLCPEVNVAKAEVIPDSPVIKVSEPVMFDFDSDVIRDDQYATINNVAKIMSDNNDIILMLEGHASVEGPESYNLDLSQRRADSVKSVLVDLGVSSERISTNGMGETDAFGEELSTNRRVMVLSIQ
jgi:outer membrane protein OmpA-like peptidoglycan-associated protein